MVARLECRWSSVELMGSGSPCSMCDFHKMTFVLLLVMEAFITDSTFCDLRNSVCFKGGEIISRDNLFPVLLSWQVAVAI